MFRLCCQLCDNRPVFFIHKFAGSVGYMTKQDRLPIYFCSLIINKLNNEDKEVMQTNESVKSVLTQLEESLQQLTDAQYKQPCTTLFNATIGQHVRHIIELFMCLYKGYDIGIVDYDKRERDTRIENNKSFAIELLHVVTSDLNKHNKDLLLPVNYGDNSSPLLITTSFNREVIYNLEHTIHHMALIRVGINEVSDLALPDEFGVAASTIRHRRKYA